MDVLPFELIIVIASKDPLAFIKMEQASRAIHLYLQTPAGRACFLDACTVKQIDNAFTVIISLITGKCHSFFDMPAVIGASGSLYWYRNEKYHRNGGPAIISPSGHCEWIVNGKYHRDGGPAIDHTFEHIIDKVGLPAIDPMIDPMIDPGIRLYDERQVWYQYGNRHRIGGPAYINGDGSKKWYTDDKLHLTDGPAHTRANGDREWYINDKLHREDGPAVMYCSGYQAYYRHGVMCHANGTAINFD